MCVCEQPDGQRMVPIIIEKGQEEEVEGKEEEEEGKENPMECQSASRLYV